MWKINSAVQKINVTSLRPSLKRKSGGESDYFVRTQERSWYNDETRAKGQNVSLMILHYYAFCLPAYRSQTSSPLTLLLLNNTIALMSLCLAT